MRKIRLIIKREYLTRVKTKGFIIGTIAVPMMGIGFFLLVLFLVKHKPSQTLRLVIVDNSGTLAQPIIRGLDAKLENGQPEFTVEQTIDHPASLDNVQQDLRKRINGGTLDAYLLIPKDMNESFELHMRNPDNFGLIQPLSNAVDQSLIAQKLNNRGVHLDDLKEVLRGTDLKLLKVSDKGEAVEKGQTFGIAIAVMMLLYIALVGYGVLTMRSVLEEKTTRTMEVLISAVHPFELLTGKILGVAAVGFTQFLIWLTSMGILFSYGALASKISNPGSSFSSIHVPVSLLVWAAVYFFCGYFLYSSLFAAVGAACSNEQDAAQLQWFAMGPLVFCMFIYSLILNDPGSTMAIVLSEIPFFSPILMALRIALQTPPLWQIALSIGLLLLTTTGVIYLSAKIYRVGILMYGKRPSLVDMAKWLRYS